MFVSSFKFQILKHFQKTIPTWQLQRTLGEKGSTFSKKQNLGTCLIKHSSVFSHLSPAPPFFSSLSASLTMTGQREQALPGSQVPSPPSHATEVHSLSTGVHARAHTQQGFSALGTIDIWRWISLSWERSGAVMCIPGGLAASLASTH